nr:unnamed protein product [Callosobruchus chinensis]
MHGRWRHTPNFATQRVGKCRRDSTKL